MFFSFVGISLLIILVLSMATVGLLLYIIFIENMEQATLDTVQQKVNDIETVEGSAISLLEQLSGMIIAAKNDPAKIQAIADQLDAQKAALANAVIANTPAQ